MGMPSIYQIADRIGCHYTTVSRMRGGVRRPSPELLIRMCEVFGWDKAEALGKYAEGRDAAASWISVKLQELPEEGDEKLPE